MAVIKNYNPTLHDIYTFNGTPTLVRTNPPGSNSLVAPTGLNENSIILDSTYNFPSIDWSGLHVRDRGFISYGWANPVSTFTQYNSQGQASRGGEFCYTQGGCSESQWNYIEDYNNWNNGQWALVLVSPQYLLACNHYVGPNMIAYVQFIGKDGTVYQAKRATKVAAFVSQEEFERNPSWYVDCVRLGESTGSDLALFKLDEELTETEQENITVYPLVKLGTIPPNKPFFVQDPNGKCLPRVFLTAKESNGSIFHSAYPLIDEKIPDQLYRHKGDSGSPALINIQNKTCFLSFLYGGVLYPQTINDLITYVKSTSDYDIELVDGGYLADETSLEPTTPLTEHPYLSRYSTKQSTLNYDFIAFKPTFNLQASELNELQEMFFTQQSKTIEMVHNWFGYKLLDRQLAKGPNNISKQFLDKFTNKDVLSSKWSTLTPIDPNTISVEPNNSIQVNSGWYFLKNESDGDFKLSAFKWIYLPNNYVFDTPENGKYATLTTKNTTQICVPNSESTDTLFLRDNTYFSYDSNPPCGANRMVTEIDTEIPPSSVTLPTSGITISNPIVFYKDSEGKAYLPNGYQL